MMLGPVVVGMMEGGLLVTLPILLGSYRSVGGCAAAGPHCVEGRLALRVFIAAVPVLSMRVRRR